MRWRKDLTSNKSTIERPYFVTSLPSGAASGARIAAWIRGHWKIENQLHHVRDTTFAEDASTLRAGRLPRVMASLRNLAISVCRQEGRTNIAAATRHHARHPGLPLATLGWTWSTRTHVLNRTEPQHAESPHEADAVINHLRDDFGVELVCREPDLSVSAYNARGRRPASARHLRDERLVEHIRRIHAASGETYGARRVHRQLRREGVHAARCTVERLMREDGLEGGRRLRGVGRAARPGRTRFCRERLQASSGRGDMFGRCLRDMR
ncbi:IS3 family transposase [Streptomyces hirsutus]|uniref:IS3 family transposase n=1 Tax=Streptomyces hirsutus TaxID=35620 RepID=UPI0033D048CD